MTELGQTLGNDVTARFVRLLTNDKQALALAREAMNSASYETANRYSVRSGELMGEALADETQTLAYMSYDVARETLTPLMTANHEAVTTVTNSIQANMNKAAGVGLAPAPMELDTSRIDGLAAVVAQSDTTTEALQRIAEPLINSSQSIVDRGIKDNAKANSKAGLKATIVRRTESGGTRTRTQVVRRGNKVYHYQRQYTVPCNWCANLAGVYDYDSVKNTGNDVFRRHESCRCTVTYKIGNQRQDVWSKRTWTETEAAEQRQLTARELRAQQRAEREERNNAQTTKLHELGFQNVDEKLMRLCDPDLMDANIQRLEDLENRFHIFGRSQGTWIEYNYRIDSIAQTSAYPNNFAHQGLVYSKDYRDINTILNQQRRTSGNGWHMPCNLESDYDVMTYTTAHEYGHAMHNLFYRQAQLSGEAVDRAEFVAHMDIEVFDIARDLSNDESFNPFDHLSRYGKKNAFEMWAEMFANSQCGAPNILGEAMNVWLQRKGF